MIYREINFFIGLPDKLKKFLHIKRAPHFSTLQKFFRRMPTNISNKINQIILIENEINPKNIALNGSGFSNAPVDKYYTQIRNKKRKSYIKNHITIDVESSYHLNRNTKKPYI